MMHTREEPENIAIEDGVWSNRDLLNQLYAVAVGIRDFVVLGARLELTQLIVEVKDELLLVNARNFTFDNTTKSKTKESSEKKLATPRKASTSKAKDGPILLEETGERDSLSFSDVYLGKAFKLSKLSGSSGKRSKSSSQSSPCSTGGITKLARKEARQREVGVDLGEKVAPKKRARASGKSSMKQMLRALALEKRVLPEAAVAEVVAAKVKPLSDTFTSCLNPRHIIFGWNFQYLRAPIILSFTNSTEGVQKILDALPKKQYEAARTEMTELLDEIRGMAYDNYNDLPSDITEIWIAAHAKQLRNSFDLQSTVVRHALIGSITTSDIGDR